MNFLEEKILADGKVCAGDILKVDSFLNHQIDMGVMRWAAGEFKRRYDGVRVDKILTIEASGIAIAVMLGDMYDVPVVFAKKAETVNSTDDKYRSRAFSFTHKEMNDIVVSRPYLSKGERILIVDDFLADGQAARALIDIVGQAGAEVVGLGMLVEKGQQGGGTGLRSEGYRVESIAIIDSMDDEAQTIKFRDSGVQQVGAGRR
ncbi:MAG: xanthine phosphoribosyltransferase [Bacteroidaceae bacterium]|nr:xanthine phosphoribosyltransferase [Bacteroidaceae bacterium]